MCVCVCVCVRVCVVFEICISKKHFFSFGLSHWYNMDMQDTLHQILQFIPFCDIFTYLFFLVQDAAQDQFLREVKLV